MDQSDQQTRVLRHKDHLQSASVKHFPVLRHQPMLLSSHSEVISKRLTLCNLLWVTLLRQGVGLDDPQRSLPTLNIL